MSKRLVIVESPGKARTVNKYLGSEFHVMACYGHVRDLRPKEGAVDPDNDFAMHYEEVERNAKHVAAIVRWMKKASALYLATDPDREGEAISWHLVQILQDRNVLNGKDVHRVVFNEVTKGAIGEAVAHPRELSGELINAQQARRALDYLVGFNLSPLLWKKIRGGLSAGRVQSPALRMIVEREEEIEAFRTREYWTIEADLESDEQLFGAKLNRFHDEKLSQFSIDNEARAREVERELVGQAGGQLRVSNVEKKQRKRHPSAPFTTSTLQQEAARKLGFTAQRTMRIAQQLYEGVETESGRVGVITYMRTDSVNLANEALVEIREFITQQYGPANLPAKPRTYKTRAKNAQEAHEAVRPTSVLRVPDSLKPRLNDEQFKLYTLVWKRTVASQMQHAAINTVTVDFACGEPNNFRATGSTVVHPGFLTLYEEGIDDREGKDDEAQPRLPPLAVGDVVKLQAIRPQQHFTEPPPRYSEATLIRTLEEYGIGRPSTYASIISTLQQREYALLEKRRFKPTDVGRVVTKFLTQHFSRYIDYDFTARMEDQLDAIARGEKDWVPVMKDFWTEFKQQVDAKAETVKRSDVTQEVTEESCPDCGKALAIRLGRRGRFIGCTGFPDCSYTRSLQQSEEQETPDAEIVAGRTCPNCDSALVVKQGRYGKFIGCSAYPNCKYVEAVEKPVDTHVACASCGEGTLLKRKSRRGKVFYSCSTYPTCKYALWNEPLDETCPLCKWPTLTIKSTKRRGTEKVCPQSDCTYTSPLELPETAAS